jgi:hypothetical protein
LEVARLQTTARQVIDRALHRNNRKTSHTDNFPFKDIRGGLPAQGLRGLVFSLVLIAARPALAWTRGSLPLGMSMPPEG